MTRSRLHSFIGYFMSLWAALVAFGVLNVANLRTIEVAALSAFGISMWNSSDIAKFKELLETAAKVVTARKP